MLGSVSTKEELRQQFNDKAAQAEILAGRAERKAEDLLGTAKSRVRGMTGEARLKLDGFVRKHPALTVMGAIAAGYVFGSLIFREKHHR